MIWSSDGKLFMGRKDPNKGGVYNKVWHIPGGGVDEGETDMEALRREMREETGIDIKGLEVELIDDKGRGESEKTLKDTGERVRCEMDFYVYRIQLKEKADDMKICLSDDLVEYKWYSVSELAQVESTPPSQVLFRKLGLI